MLDGSLAHTRDASASPGFLLAETATPQSSRRRHGDRPWSRGPPTNLAAAPPRREAKGIGDLFVIANQPSGGEAMGTFRISVCTLAATALSAAAAWAVVTPPAGYIYSTQLLSNLTQGCVAAGPGGTFVGIGPGFTANAQSIVLAKESGELRLVASGFNSISDCAYDQANDVLYITDNADNGDFGLSGPFAAQSGDTVFAVPSASTASGRSAPDVELLPPDSIPFAANVTVDAAGDVFVADAAGSGGGSVLKIVGTTPSPFASSFDFTG